jgi:hypothetical protein
MNFLDFGIELGLGETGIHPVAIRSPAGETRTQFQLPSAWAGLIDEGGSSAMLLDGPDSAAARPPPTSPTGTQPGRRLGEPLVQSLGRMLFEELLQGDALRVYYESLAHAQAQGDGLRIKLNILAPELALIPWELLFDPRAGEFLALARQTPVIRYLELSQPMRSLSVTPPIQVLGVAINVSEFDTLDLQAERMRLEKALAPLQGRIQLTWLQGQSWPALLQAMRSHPWHVLHYVGHGGFDPATGEGLVLFADEQGNAQPFTAGQFARMVADCQTLRLVTLNVCDGARASARDNFASTAATLLRRGVPAVVAMQSPISDQAALSFAQAFYSAIADGMPVDSAVSEARKALSFAPVNNLEWMVPVLYMRAPDGRILDILPAPATQANEKEAPGLALPGLDASAQKPHATFSTHAINSEIGEVINIHTLQGGLTIGKDKKSDK